MIVVNTKLIRSTLIVIQKDESINLGVPATFARREGGQAKANNIRPRPKKRERAHSLPTPLPAHAEQMHF